MQDEHAKALQLAAVVVNFLELVFRLPDEGLGVIVPDAALEQGKNLVELLRPHIFRENNVVFAMAHRLISTAKSGAPPWLSGFPHCSSLRANLSTAFGRSA